MDGETNETSIQIGEVVEMEFEGKGREKERKCRVLNAVRYVDKIYMGLKILGTLGALSDEKPCILYRSQPLKFSNPNIPLYSHLSSIYSMGSSVRK